MEQREYTHPDVLGKGVAEGWADPETDPTRIDWKARQMRAAIGFIVADRRPVNPCERTGIRYGRNELGHWGEALCADAIVTATDAGGLRRLAMIKRGDGHDFAVPGGHVEPGEDPTAAALRELKEETGLVLDGWDHTTETLPVRYVPDPRASDEAWMVTVPVLVQLTGELSNLPWLIADDDAADAGWVPAPDYAGLVDALRREYGGEVFRAHQDMLRELLG
ncbi:NUDIX domain-containing protein [Micromonospora sp. NPDC005652]|uniref:NUDIX domain-containing protein n=1 Tax=Micromonospora sp. NPDC005652 TaxID=3157046 RepID=UPI0034092C18